MTDVADAIAAVKSGETSYGTFYVSEVRFGFEGEDTGYRVIPNEHGDYDIESTLEF
jgi:ABC-type molybdate transport system substrate-binding protein